MKSQPTAVHNHPNRWLSELSTNPEDRPPRIPLVRPAKLLHIADVHLGLSDAGLDGLEERAFAKAVDLAIEADLDAVLIAGDLFDHARVSDDLLAWTAKQLDRLQRPVVLLVGNHDTLHDASVHDRFRVGERCAQALFLDDPEGSLIEIPGTDVVVWGRAMVEHVPSFRPLAGIPAKPADKWGVVAGHGLVLFNDRPSHHASPIAPSEIDGIDWDYIALGHHHAHKVLRGSPRPAVYPGATARSLKGQPGAVLVDFVPSVGVGVEWRPLAI